MLIPRILICGVFCLGIIACGEKQVRREGVLLPYSKAAQIELEDIRKKHEGKDTSAFIQALQKFIQDYPDAPAASEAEALLAALQPESIEFQPAPKTFETKKQIIGCILPLSGKYASYGMKSLRGIQQALQFFESSSTSFELAIYDSKGDPREAAEGISYLVEHHGVMAIIGPLLTQESAQAAAKAQELQVPLLNLSQHPTITEVGDYIFRNAMTKQHQTDTLIDYACGERGLRKFAILYPQDSYGIEFANQFWDKVEECGGTIEGIEAYASDQSD
ncbi:MAG: penicillin-binding protein activator, partial [Deltaproteobacteria bacterium]|nr:penicillin-binding protein activator [Deltaproteobacteria bacterium]